ncbi:hypothetical protein CO610_09040 [Lysobacteraceae bacterium NML95-0200]|nr:hypothetical protein CO610_09040 [Xanthomonadaceae bacterium NML95-0200]
MRWLLALKSARLQQELGNSKMAWQILRGIAVSADAEYVPGLLPAIGVLLSRMEEENGSKIMAAGIEPLLRRGGVDLEAWCEQHQVFAMQAVMDARRAVFEGVSLDRSLLNKLLLHFESALFGALLRWNPQRIQGLVRRLAWCLHLLLESNVVSVRQVMQWHALASDYGEELDVSVSGNDFAYLGQFWLDNVAAIRKEGEKDGRLMARLVVADLAPRCESFYRCGIDRVRNSGNQWALGLCLLNYLRFARNMGDFSKASEECKQQLFELLQGNPKICQRLQDVGLLKHLPSGFAKILR